MMIFFPFVAAADRAFLLSFDFFMFMIAGAWFVLFVVWANPRRRGRMLMRVNNFFAGPEARAAGAISAMIGGESQTELLDVAREQFCGIAYSSLTPR